MISKKAAIFIDNAYFSKICLHFGRPKTCFEKFTNYIASKSEIENFDVYIYDCMPYQSKKPTRKERMRYANKDKFFAAMRKKGFIVRLGKLQRFGTTFKQKKVDTLWTVDISRLAFTKEIDTAILISGDSDFVPGLQAAKSAGVHI